MDHLFRPWRFAYVTAERKEEGCVLCSIPEDGDDARRYVIGRFVHHYVVLNTFPYNTGHLMLVPYAHVARLGDLTPAARTEWAELAARAERALSDIYRPDGLNIGMNLGACAGAGIAAHIHLHVVPRWSADTGFITVPAETRILPESLDETWRKLHGRL